MCYLLYALRPLICSFTWGFLHLGLTFMLSAQFIYVADLRDTEMRPCEVNPEVELLVPKFARIYQTLDDTPFGILDSSICPSVINRRIDMNSIRPGRLFVEINIPENARKLVPGNSLFAIYNPFNHSTKLGSALLKIDHEEIILDRSTSTWYETLQNEPFSNEFDCVRIENFSQSIPNSFIYSIIVENTSASAPPIFFLFAGLEQLDFLDHEIWGILFTENYAFNGGFKGQLVDLVQTVQPNNYFGNYYISHPDIQQARRGITSYFDIKAPARLQKDTLTIEVSEYTSLFTHPYVTIRSDFINSNSGERHVVKLVQDSDMCIPPFVDLVVEEGVYHFKSGHLALSGQGSCILLRKNSKLQVADRTHFDYGRGGIGMLGLSGASQIALGKDALLTIDNQVALIYEEGINEMPSVTLNRGQSLLFGPNASIRDINSPLQNIVLKVFMNGGFLDVASLDPISRQHIQLVYPAPSSILQDNSKIYQDPQLGTYQLEWIANTQSDIRCTIVDLHGRSIDQFTLSKGEGWQVHEFNLFNQVAGIFILVVESNGQVAYHKLLKL